MNQTENGLKVTPDATTNQDILDLVAKWNVPEFSRDFAEMIGSLYQLSQQSPNSSDMVLFKRSLAELRYAQKVFAPYRNVKKVTIFGSARTRAGSKIYAEATDFARLMTEAGYMAITGAGEGIMGAAQKGAGAAKSFGLNIMLPFEQGANEVIRGDAKLVTFRYFFTRKLTFLREASAVAAFPGGFGTLDEVMEVMTLMQTGKARLIPMVLIDEPRGTYWKNFLFYLSEHQMADKLISPEDFNLCRLTTSVDEAREEVLRFYRNFHSYRFIGRYLVIRLQHPVSERKLDRLRQEFLSIISPDREMFQRSAFPEEANEPSLGHLSRLCLTFNRIHYGFLRHLIDRLNEDEPI